MEYQKPDYILMLWDDNERTQSRPCTAMEADDGCGCVLAC